MEIKLTEEQYKTLVEMLYLGEWMINACRSPKETIKKYQDLEQHVYSFAKAGGLERYIEYDEESKKYFPTKELEMESEAEEYRLEFENETFWDELIERLSLRDLISQLGEETVEKLDGVKRYKRQSVFINKYNKEFAKHGIENLGLVHPGEAKPALQ